MASILIPLAPGFEELEAVTLIDLFRRANFEVSTAGLLNNPIKASRSTLINADHLLETVKDQDFDLICLPGGQPGTNNLNGSPALRAMLQKQFDRNGLIAAICAAPLILAEMGMLDDKKATSFPDAIDLEKYPKIQYVKEAVVKHGNIVTSRGPGTAMDFALFLIELLAGIEKRKNVETPLQRSRPNQ